MKKSTIRIYRSASLRLKGYDYSKSGAYFITICCQDQIHRLGSVVDKKMILNEFGEIAYNEWTNLANRFHNFELDVFQIMPNHMHGIIILKDDAAPSGFTPDDHSTNSNNDIIPEGSTARVDRTMRHTIGDIVGAYKSLVANGCLKLYKERNQIMGRFWHRDYYEVIIRDPQSYYNISQYIIHNPEKWGEDKLK